MRFETGNDHGKAQRATLYHLAAETGLRASELWSLTAASFSLDACPPTVTVQAAYTKNRRRDTLCLAMVGVTDLLIVLGNWGETCQ